MAATFSVTVPGEAAVSITLSTEAVQGITAFLTSLSAGPPAASGFTPLSTTLAAPALATDTTFTLVSATGLATGNGLVIGTEFSLVTGIASNVATVVRARLGTAAAAYLTGATVQSVRNGSYGVYIANLITDAVRLAIVNFPGSTIAAADAAIATQQATIAAAVAAAVTHTP